MLSTRRVLVSYKQLNSNTDLILFTPGVMNNLVFFSIQQMTRFFFIYQSPSFKILIPLKLPERELGVIV